MKKSLLLPLMAILLLGLLAFQTNDQMVFTDERDGNQYELVELQGLKWFKENLRFRSASGKDTLIEPEECGVFYLLEDAQKACPKGWRLPKEAEVKALIKADKKNKLRLNETLNIPLCGRIDYEKHSKPGLQNTFWLAEALEDGSIMHWHTFKEENKMHSHNVINARRKFPVRCVCELK